MTKSTDVSPDLIAIATTIRDTPLCAACIASRFSMTLADLDVLLLRLRTAIRPVMTLGPCEGCQRDTLRYQIT